MENDEETAFMGLTDIISNLMVLFILLTVFVLTIKVNEASQENAAFGSNGDSGGLFPTTLNSEVYGLVTTIVVAENGFARLSWEAIADHISNQSTVNDLALMTSPIYVPQREGAAAPDGLKPYVAEARTAAGANTVIDGYLIKFELEDTIPDWAIITPDAKNMAGILLAQADPGTDLSFIVYAEGMAQFVPVYEALIEQGACFRWIPGAENKKYTRSSVSYAGQNRCPK